MSAAAGLLVRAPHLAVTWQEDRPMLVDAATGNVFAVSAPVLEALRVAGEPAEPDRLAAAAGVDRSLVDGLAAARLLLPPGGLPAPDHWSTPELMVQRMAGGGGMRPDLDPDAMPPMRKGSWSPRVISLPDGPAVPGAPLDAVLAARRSRRRFAPGELGLAELGSLLRGAAGVQGSLPEDGVSFRPHPSGGGRHPLELTVVAYRVGGLEPGAYWFDAFDPALHELDPDPELLAQLPVELGSSLGLPRRCDAPAVLLVTAVFARTMWKYEGIGLGLVYRDTGCLLQTLHLVATALGLAATPAHLRREADFARWLGLDPMQESLTGCLAVGLPA
jgi:SagB-type dehydrogenase family enzyme